jgi:hypothetical protein
MSTSDRQLILAAILSLIVCLPFGIVLERAWTQQNAALIELQR